MRYGANPVLCYNCVNFTASDCLIEFINLSCQLDTSDTSKPLIFLFGQRSFSDTAPSVWNTVMKSGHLGSSHSSNLLLEPCLNSVLLIVFECVCVCLLACFSVCMVRDACRNFHYYCHKSKSPPPPPFE